MARGDDNSQELANPARRKKSGILLRGYINVRARSPEKINKSAEPLQESDFQETILFLEKEFAEKITENDKTRREKAIKDLFPGEDDPHSVLHRVFDTGGLFPDDYKLSFTEKEGKILVRASSGSLQDEKLLDLDADIKENTDNFLDSLCADAEERLKEAVQRQQEAVLILSGAGLSDLSKNSPTSKFIAQLGDEIYAGHPFYENSYPHLSNFLNKPAKASELLRIFPACYKREISLVKRGAGEVYYVSVKTPDGKVHTREEVFEKEAREKMEDIIFALARERIEEIKSKQKEYSKKQKVFLGLDTDIVLREHYADRVYDLGVDSTLGNLSRYDVGRDYSVVVGNITFTFPKSDNAWRDYVYSGMQDPLQTKNKKGDLILIFKNGKLISSSGLKSYEASKTTRTARFFPGVRNRILRKKALNEIKNMIEL